MATKITDGAKIIFIGDSITDCGRRDPAYAPLGRGYVKLFSDIMIVKHPELTLDIINRGIGGDSIDNLLTRWHDDVMTQNPDFLSVKIGINDLHKHMNNKDFAFLTIDEFKRIYARLLELTVEKFPDCKLLLISPFYISRDSIEGSLRKKVLDILPEYINAVKELSQQFNTDFIDLHELFQKQLEYKHPDTYCQEPVHPNPVGHLLMAEAVFANFEQ